jgi:hypothetical protein
MPGAGRGREVEWMRVSSRSRTRVLGKWNGVFRGAIGRPAAEYVGVGVRDGGGVGIRAAMIGCGGAQAIDGRPERVAPGAGGSVEIRETSSGLTVDEEK